MALEGMPVLEPCDMHALLARREGPHPSLTMALDAPALALCLTPCLPASLAALYSSALVSFTTVRALVVFMFLGQGLPGRKSHKIGI